MKRPPGVLHCTTKYTDFGKAAGAEEYAQQEVRTGAAPPETTSNPQSQQGTHSPPRGWGRGFALRATIGTKCVHVACAEVKSCGRDGECFLLVSKYSYPVPPDFQHQLQ